VFFSFVLHLFFNFTPFPRFLSIFRRVLPKTKIGENKNRGLAPVFAEALGSQGSKELPEGIASSPAKAESS